jgi:hypothetical protein
VKGNLFPPLIIILLWKEKEKEKEGRELSKREEIKSEEEDGKEQLLSFKSEVKGQGLLQEERK